MKLDINSTFTQHSFHTSLLTLTELKALMYFLLVFRLSKAFLTVVTFIYWLKQIFQKGGLNYFQV